MENELGLDLSLIVARADYFYTESDNDVSVSYPMRCFYRRHEISYEIPAELGSHPSLQRIGLPGGHPFTTTEKLLEHPSRALEKDKKPYYKSKPDTPKDAIGKKRKSTDMSNSSVLPASADKGLGMEEDS